MKLIFPTACLAAALSAALSACRTADAQAEDLHLLEEQAFRTAVERVAGSVVQIETVGGLEQVENVLFGSGATTGLVVDADGYILSSSFAFLNLPSSILVRLPDGSRHAARLVATDHNRRIVLLKIEADRPLPVPEAALRDQMEVGEWAIAVGRSFDPAVPNVSVGILSATNRIWGKAVQTDAAVSPNNYGGPLIDVQGRVLGLLVPLSPQQGAEIAGVEWYDSGIGFAVPLCDLEPIVAELKRGKDLRPGVAGVRFSEAGLYTKEPIIESVRRGSPANKAGLEKGDRIVEIDGRPIARPADVRGAIGRRYAGQSIRVVAVRDGKRIERDVELVAGLPPYVHPFAGILPMRSPVGDGGDQETADGQEEAPAGITVRYVYPDGPADKAGIQPGDVILRLVSDASQPSAPLDAEGLLRRISDYQPGDTVELDVRRGEATERRSLRLARLPDGLPPAMLPPAGDAAVAPEAGEAATGRIQFRLPEYPNDIWGYVPEEYDPSVPHGVVVWAHAPGQADPDSVISAWKPHCDRDHLILIAPQSDDPNEWRTSEIDLVSSLIDEIDSAYTIDRTRVAVGGQETGGTLAYLVAFASRDLVRAVVAVDAPAAEPVPEYEPDQPLAVYSAGAEKSQYAGRIDEGVARLRAGNYPVTVKSLGEAPRPLDDDELAELARWIDMLDRI